VTGKTKLDKQIDRRVEQAYYRSCSGVAINMLDIPKVFAAGRAAVANGVSDEALETAIRAYVETIRQNY
jgi:hypothetical protein